MSEAISVLEQTTANIGGVNYIITALPAEYGLEVMNELFQDTGLNPQRVKEIILKSVTVNGKLLNSVSFDKHFARKYNELSKLTQVILTFNFGSEETVDAEGNGSLATESDDTTA